MSPQNNHLQRPPAAVLYADELAKLKQNDNAPCPPGWQLSLPAARAFILGDSAQNISRKVVISPSAVERMLVTSTKPISPSWKRSVNSRTKKRRNVSWM